MNRPVYVAGKTHDYLRVRTVQGWVRELGGEITYDWTVDVERIGPDHEKVAITPEDAQVLAVKDRAGVWALSPLFNSAIDGLLIALAHPQATGTLWELGMAAALQIPTIMVGPFRYSVFQELPNVRCVPDDNALLAILPPLLARP